MRILWHSLWIVNLIGIIFYIFVPLAQNKTPDTLYVGLVGFFGILLCLEKIFDDNY